MAIAVEQQVSGGITLGESYDELGVESVLEGLSTVSHACSAAVEETIQRGELTSYLLIKRAFDIVGALVLLTLILPMAVAVALAVRLSSPGPIFYKQRRIGRNAQPFMMLKFRSMKTGVALPPEAQGCKVFKSKNDPRVTRIGRLIRKTSLDEIPQLVNVLRGEMSFVGPRPELEEMLEYYGPAHYRRHDATPGLTGWWQTHSRVTRCEGFQPQEDVEQKFNDDMYYLAHQSLVLDLRILVMTIPVVLFGRGAV